MKAYLFLVFFQSQQRINGCYTKSIHKFELPGGFDNNGIPRLKTLGKTSSIKLKLKFCLPDFLLDGNSMQRYYSCTQAEMGNGL